MLTEWKVKPQFLKSDTLKSRGTRIAPWTHHNNEKLITNLVTVLLTLKTAQLFQPARHDIRGWKLREVTGRISYPIKFLLRTDPRSKVCRRDSETSRVYLVISFVLLLRALLIRDMAVLHRPRCNRVLRAVVSTTFLSCLTKSTRRGDAIAKNTLVGDGLRAKHRRVAPVFCALQEKWANAFPGGKLSGISTSLATTWQAIPLKYHPLPRV